MASEGVEVERRAAEAWCGDGGRTDGGGDVGVEVGGGDEADEEAALADARVPDEEDLEGALVAAAAAAAPRTRRPHTTLPSPQIPPDSAAATRARNACARGGRASRGRRAGRGGGIEGARGRRRGPAVAPWREGAGEGDSCPDWCVVVLALTERAKEIERAKETRRTWPRG